MEPLTTYVDPFARTTKALRAGCHRGRLDRWLRRAVRGPRLSLAVLHNRHPDFWTDPDRFDPGRWTRDAETARHGHSYHPFAAGPRICIGDNFSMLESNLLLAILARRFRPRLRDEFVPHFVMHGTLSIEGGLPAVIETR